MEHELYRKALDQVERLLANYQAGIITEQSFRIGIETVWACLGGIVEVPEFHELMSEANAALCDLPAEETVTVMLDEVQDFLVAQVRKGSAVRQLFASKLTIKERSFEFEHEAASFVGRTQERAAQMGMNKAMK